MKIWSYISLTNAIEQNIIQVHLESDPIEPIVSRIEVYSEAYLEPAQAFKMLLYAENVNGIEILIFFEKKLHFKYLTRF